MRWLTETDLAGIYGQPSAPSLDKVADCLVPDYRAFVEKSRFCILSTVGPEGIDASPRGDDGPVVSILDKYHLALPDWRGNNRIDSIHNITRDPRASLMFLVRGSDMVLRANGQARVTDDAALRAGFEKQGQQPRTVIVLQLAEVYFQCARAPMRAGLWSGADDSAGLPTAGQMLARLSGGQTGGTDYDREWPVRAAKTMW